MALALTVYSIGLTNGGDCGMVLDQLRAQTIRQRLEVLVVAPSDAGLEPEELDGFGAARLLAVPPIDHTGSAMAEAVRAARAPFVTYAEEHSYFDERWAERLVASHAAGHDVVGFAMENANPQTITSWAQLYGQFGPVVAPAASGERTALGGHHVSYRTRRLLEYGELLEDMLEHESAMLMDLQARGVRLYLDGQAISRHVNISSPVAYARMDYHGQRGFAAARAAVGRWPRAKRLLYAAGSPLVPFVRLRRILADVRRTRRTHLLPSLLGPLSVALVAGAVGELLGYLAGAGRSAERRAGPELDRQHYLGRKDHWRKEEHRGAAG